MKLLVIFCVSLSLPTYSDYTNLGWNTDEYEDDDSHFLLSREKRGAPGEGSICFKLLYLEFSVVTKAQKTLYDQIRKHP